MEIGAGESLLYSSNLSMMSLVRIRLRFAVLSNLANNCVLGRTMMDRALRGNLEFTRVDIPRAFSNNGKSFEKLRRVFRQDGGIAIFLKQIMNSNVPLVLRKFVFDWVFIFVNNINQKNNLQHSQGRSSVIEEIV